MLTKLALALDAEPGMIRLDHRCPSDRGSTTEGFRQKIDLAPHPP